MDTGFKIKNIFKGYQAVLLPAGMILKKMYFFVIPFMYLLYSGLEKQSRNLFKKNTLILSAGFIACLQYGVMLRSNILLMPSIFIGIFYAAVFLFSYKNKFLRIPAIAAYVFLVLAGFFANQAQQTALQPDSIHVLREDISILKATQTGDFKMPPDRLVKLSGKLYLLLKNKSSDPAAYTLSDFNYIDVKKGVFDLM